MVFLAPWKKRGKVSSGLAISINRAIRGMGERLEGLADSILHGDRLSGFPGRGMEAAGVREYQAGDEARGIDWRVTARKGRLHVRIFDEERDLPSIIVLHRPATLGGGRNGIREVRAMEVGGILSALSLKSGDRAGLLQGGTGFRGHITPSRRKDQLLMILSRLLEPPPDLRRESMAEVLMKTRRFAKERSRIFLISDFQLLEGEQAEVKRLLAEVGQRHALHPVRILDQGEGCFPDEGALPLRDPRTGALRRKGSEGGEGLREALNQDEDRVAHLFRDVGLREWRVDVGDLLVPTLRTCMAGERVRGGPRG